MRVTWRDRHVVVTGGSSGIGLALTRRLRDAGANVSVLALDDQDLQQTPGPSRGVDVSDAAAVAQAIAELVAESGPVRSLFTCAGIVKPGYVESFALSDFRAQLEVNYFGTVHAIRAVLPGMMTAGNGTITCISSAAGLLGVFGYAPYSASKFAVRGLCETLRQELRPHGISVTAVYPPDVDTPMLAKETPLKPPELRLISGTIKPLSADTVAAAMMRGTAAGKPTVIPDLSTRLVRLAAGAAPWLVNRVLDGKIDKARREKS
ncbi:MAG TPA: SDR family NAD(P)-dependent oxidoreductase [Pseudonocardiaceae bacterium]|nr:SDR family NAD(P)-dependent oxidoreductase [Pseudonocardiaceae bacterium]